MNLPARVAVGYQHPGWVHEAFMRSMMAVQREIAPDIIAKRSGSLLGPARSEILRGFLTQTDATHLLFVDTDQIFTPDDVWTLLNREVALVSGLVMAQGESRHGRPGEFWIAQPAAKIYTDVGLGPLMMIAANSDALLPVAGFGMAFTLIERGVAEAVAEEYAHPFEESWYEHAEGNTHLDPDVAFCLRASDAGYQPFVDPTVKIGHIKEAVIWP